VLIGAIFLLSIFPLRNADVSRTHNSPPFGSVLIRILAVDNLTY